MARGFGRWGVGFLLSTLGGVALAGPASQPLSPLALAEDLRVVNAAALTEAIASPTPRDRARAAVALGRIQKAAAIDSLLKLLRDADPEVRRPAAFALGQFGWKREFAAGREAEILAGLQVALGDADFGTRLAAVEAIGKVGLEKTPAALMAVLSDARSELRAEAVMALYRYRLVLRLRDPAHPAAELPADVIARLLALAKDADFAVRRNVAYFFARTQDLRGLDAVIALSADSAADVRYFATLALQKQADARGVDAAVGRLTDSGYTIRVAAINALAAMHAVAKIPSAPVLKDAYWHVRAAYADALANADAESDFGTLEMLTSDSSAAVRAQTLLARVARSKDQALALIKAGLKDPAFQIRAAAAVAASKLTPPSVSEELLLVASRDADVRVRSAAVDGLGPIATVTAWAAVRTALTSAEPAEKGAAIGALGARKERELAQVAWDAFRAIPDAEWASHRLDLIQPVLDLKTEQTTAWLRQALAAETDRTVVAKIYSELLARKVADLGAQPERPFTVSPYRELVFTTVPHVILETTRGTIDIECFPRMAPIHVANFYGRARDGLYDGKAWHRVVSDFVVQGGSPDGAGWASPGYEVRAEVNPARFDRGALGMPRGDTFDSGSDELFITHVPAPHLDGQYTVFGRVVKGLEAIDAMEVGDLIVKARVVD